MSSAMPGPTDCTSVSVVNAPPDVQKYRMNTSDNVVTDRASFMGAKVATERSRHNAS
jgi:hypothetical protein